MAPKKPLKDVDSTERAYFLKIVTIFISWGLFALPVFLYIFGWFGLIIWFLSCLTLSIMVEFITDKFGSLAGRIFTGRGSDWSIQEQLRGDIDIVRVQKAKGEYDTAILKVEEILARDPNFAEAVYLKAQLIFEGYEEKAEALHCLDKVFALTQPDDPLRRWAFLLKKQINSHNSGND